MASTERVLRVVVAFADLSAEERRDAADEIIALAATGAPPPAFTTMQEEADSWTVFADAAELAVYGVAIAAELRRRGRQELRALFAAAWRALPEADRLAFLTRATGGKGAHHG